MKPDWRPNTHQPSPLPPSEFPVPAGASPKQVASEASMARFEDAISYRRKTHGPYRPWRTRPVEIKTRGRNPARVTAERLSRAHEAGAMQRKRKGFRKSIAQRVPAEKAAPTTETRVGVMPRASAKNGSEIQTVAGADKIVHIKEYVRRDGGGSPPVRAQVGQRRPDRALRDSAQIQGRLPRAYRHQFALPDQTFSCRGFGHEMIAAKGRRRHGQGREQQEPALRRNDAQAFHQAARYGHENAGSYHDDMLNRLKEAALSLFSESSVMRR